MKWSRTLVKVKAVVDRLENGCAVLLIGDEERKLNVPSESLPNGSREGQWLQVELEGDRLVSVEIDMEETARAKQRIMEKLERLRKGEHLT